jgi:hypothetical protein
VDASEHNELVWRVKEWFESRAGHDMSVQSHMGSNSTYIATGPFLRVEKHPTAEGVYRALFDDSLTAGSNAPPAFVAFGWELQDVQASADGLTLEMGSQRVEILDRSAPARPTAAEVEWPSEATIEAPAQPEAAMPIVTLPAPPPPPPPPPVAPETSDEDAFWTQHEPMESASGPEIVAPPPPPPPVYAPPAPVPAYPPPPPSHVAPLPAYVAPAAGYPAPSPQGLDLQVDAPLYSNCFGSRFFGPIAMHVEQGWMTLIGRRTPEGFRSSANLLVGGTMLLVFGGIALALGITAFAYDGSAESPITQAVLIGGLLMLIPGLVMRLVAAPRLRQGDVETVQFPLPVMGDRRVRYDSNLGCLLMLFATPVIGLIIMLVMGRRIASLSAPIGSGGANVVAVLKTRSSADGGILDVALRGR